MDHQLPTVGLCCAFIIQCLLFSDDHRKKATGKCQTLTLSPFSPSALFNEERAGFSINGVGISTCKRMKLDPYLTPYGKINSKQVKTQLLEENIVGKLHDTGFANDLLVMTLKTQATKGKVCKLDFITVTNLCIRAHEQQRKKAPQGMEKVSGNAVSEQGSMPLYPPGFKVSNRWQGPSLTCCPMTMRQVFHPGQVLSFLD